MFYNKLNDKNVNANVFDAEKLAKANETETLQAILTLRMLKTRIYNADSRALLEDAIGKLITVQNRNNLIKQIIVYACAAVRALSGNLR